MNSMHTPINTESLYQSNTTVDDEKHNQVNILGYYDVICGRHKAAFDNIGNRRFRVLVSLAHEKYANAPTRAHKSSVIKEIIDSVHNGGGRFLQRLGSVWVELDDKQTHDKVGHALRDMAVASKTKQGNRKSMSHTTDFSDRSKASRTSSNPETVHTTRTIHEMTTKEKNCDVFDGYIVHVPNKQQVNHSDANCQSSRIDSFDLDGSIRTLEPIPWPAARHSSTNKTVGQTHVYNVNSFVNDGCSRSTI
jgi:hypothetical protein